MNKVLKTLSTLLCGLALMHGAHAETIQIPVASQAADKQSVERPRTGESGQSVLERFGEPLNSSQPVGDPPITRWEYQDYYVFFEYNHVIHSVLKHRANNS